MIQTNMEDKIKMGLRKEENAEIDTTKNLIDGLTEEQVKEYKESFLMFDLDGDGTVTTSVRLFVCWDCSLLNVCVVQELGTVMQKLGQRTTEKELDDMMKEVDLDGNGSIELDEFLRMMATRIKDNEVTNKQITAVFNVFDKNSDG